MIIDAFLARNEFDLVSFRMAYLENDVDLFLIGESQYSFSGQPKPLEFRNWAELGQLHKKAVVVEIPLGPEVEMGLGKTELQSAARRKFLEYVIEKFPDETIFFSDADEIPSREQVKEAGQLGTEPWIRAVPMTVFYRRINWRLRRDSLWKAPKVFRGIDPMAEVRLEQATPLEAEPGVHYSYLDMTEDTMKMKLDSLAAAEFNNPRLSGNRFLHFCDEYGLDHLARADQRGFGLLDHVSVRTLGDCGRAASTFSKSWTGQSFPQGLVVRAIAAQIARQYRDGIPIAYRWIHDRDTFAFLRLLPTALFHIARTWFRYSWPKIRKNVKKKLRRLVRGVREQLARFLR